MKQPQSTKPTHARTPTPRPLVDRLAAKLREQNRAEATITVHAQLYPEISSTSEFTVTVTSDGRVIVDGRTVQHDSAAESWARAACLQARANHIEAGLKRGAA